ncbi:MAG TPA: coenzyme F420-0:L-glutamate ligase [Nitrososphaerales archaeon]|nr:coenzyme F420-0:L-glutamate ligase [Nitrososphaerales archaeon]
MEFYGVKLPLVKQGDDYVKIIVDAINQSGHAIEEKDIIVIASKIVSSALGMMVDISKIKPSQKAKAVAKKYGLNPNHIQLILNESDEVYGGVAYQNPKFIVYWTRKGEAFEINSGVDIKNSPIGMETVDIPEPNKVADEIRRRILELTGRKTVGILIIDSNWYPLRNGSIGFTVGLSGFEPVKNCTVDENGKPAYDIYGRPVPLARHNVADDIAAGAHLLVGEAGERVGVVIAKNTPAQFSDNPDYNALYLTPKECTIMRTFKPTRKIVVRKQWRDSEPVPPPAPPLQQQVAAPVATGRSKGSKKK